MGYLFPFPRSVRRSQDFGANPGWGPNPPGGHNGDDWAVPVGTPIRAPGDGVVVFAGEFDDTYADNWGWNLMYGGKMVILNMDGDFEPYFEFGHNSELRVKTGDRVRRGQVFALSGNSDGGTGVSTGPHSHVGCLPYNFNLNTNTYGRVNPRLFMTDYWDDEAGAASIGPAGDIIPMEEDDMYTDADRDRDKLTAERVTYLWDTYGPGKSEYKTEGEMAGVIRAGARDAAAALNSVTPGEFEKRPAGATIQAMVAIAANSQDKTVSEIVDGVSEKLGDGIEFVLQTKQEDK
jgi:hypothetical protein